MDTHYYISKGSKTVGPCTLDDLQNYIAYGSVQGSDLVRREGTEHWMHLQDLEEFQSHLADPGTRHEVTARRRVARFRDYQRVPAGQRAGIVLKQLLTGFFLWPPLLWRGAKSVFQNRIYRAATDEKGYLLPLPRWVELVAAVLLVVNALFWLFILSWIWNHLGTLAQDVAALLRTGIQDLQDWLGK